MQTVNFRYLPLRAGQRVLDVGCGEGRHVISAYLEADVQSVGVDLDLTDLQTTEKKFADFAESDNDKKSFSLALANGLCLPFPDNSFDVVICSEVLEHICDYRTMLSEIARVIVPGGRLVASVPRAWPERICWALSRDYHEVEGGHVRIFNARRLRRDIEQHGFRGYYHHWEHALHVPYWWLKCLFWESQSRSYLVDAYHKLLVWDLMQRPWLTRTLERLLNPVMGKSIVMYFDKPRDGALS